MLSEHSNNISLNQELFERIKVVYGQKDSIELTPEQTKLLENAYNGFIRRGANLQGEAKEKVPGFMQRAQPADAAVQ